MFAFSANESPRVKSHPHLIWGKQKAFHLVISRWPRKASEYHLKLRDYGFQLMLQAAPTWA